MKSLKHKGEPQTCTRSGLRPLNCAIASRFFKDTPSQDEKIANADLNTSVDFDAGIKSHTVKKKRKHFLRSQIEHD
jgi:hypothetical protein